MIFVNEKRNPNFRPYVIEQYFGESGKLLVVDALNHKVN